METEQVILELVKELRLDVKDLTERVGKLEGLLSWRATIAGAVAGFLPSAAVLIYWLVKGT